LFNLGQNPRPEVVFYWNITRTWPSKSYLTPPRWRGLGNGSTPVSHHITTRLRKVDENFDLAKLGGCAWLSLTWGLGCPVGVGWVGPAWGVGPAGLLVCVLGKYLDPAGDRDRWALRTQHMGVLTFPGTILVACRRKWSRLTWFAVQFKMC